MHALIIFSEKIGLGHSITCNNCFSILKNDFTLIFKHIGSFADFHRKHLPPRRSAALFKMRHNVFFLFDF